MTSQGNSSVLRSGTQNPSAAPAGSPDVSEVVASEQELFITATNAVITLPLGGAQLYAQDTRLQSNGNLRLEHAVGSLSIASAETPISAQSLLLTGTTDAFLDGKDTAAPFKVRLGGDLSGAQADGVPLSLATTTPSPFPWLWLFGLGLVAVPTTLLARRRSRVPSSARRWRVEERADDLVAERAYEAAAPLVRKLLAWAPQDPWAHFRHAKVLGQSGDLEEVRAALRHHEEVRRLAGNLGESHSLLLVENAIEAARAAVRLHHAAPSAERARSQALVEDWVQEATLAGLDAAPEMVRHEELRPFLRSDALPFWQQA